MSGCLDGSGFIRKRLEWIMKEDGLEKHVYEA